MRGAVQLNRALADFCSVVILYSCMLERVLSIRFLCEATSRVPAIPTSRAQQGETGYL